MAAIKEITVKEPQKFQGLTLLETEYLNISAAAFFPNRHKILLEVKPMHGNRLCSFEQCMRIFRLLSHWPKGERKDIKLSFLMF